MLCVLLLLLLQGRAAALTRSVLHSSDGVVMLLDARCVCSVTCALNCCCALCTPAHRVRTPCHKQPQGSKDIRAAAAEPDSAIT
jgi:hypothetical protein